MQATAVDTGRQVELAVAAEKLDGAAYEKVRQLASGSAVVLFGTSDCCMCHVAKHLLIGLGVAPTIVQLDRLPGDHGDVSTVLRRLCSSLPAVFVGGRLVGGIESLMACHINGSLIPLLKDAGALWL